jgi:hypothetical protein
MNCLGFHNAVEYVFFITTENHVDFYEFFLLCDLSSKPIIIVVEERMTRSGEA